MQATATSTPLTCSLFPLQGFHGAAGPSKRNQLQWRNLQRKCSQKGFEIKAQFELQPPPYPLNALEPHMSKESLEFHWGKHHRAYVDNLNKQIVGTELDGLPLEDVVRSTYNKGDPLPAFNNAAQIWNHDFFWGSMKPDGGGKPSGELLEMIEKDFGSYEKFITDFKAAAATQFGAGWAWLAYKANPSEEKKLVILKSSNAVNPLVQGEDYTPILTIDVWEHSYYIDYRNRRPDYISVFVEKLVSWEAVSSRLEKAKA
ncbi:hypothetical protein MKW92_021069 [Papaver armeniacum]|nr:hypothetical protein MKW92_021069 [Papaver armeniacum]